MSTEVLTSLLEQTAKEEGAALVGFAPVERYDLLPPQCGPRPQDVFPGAKTAISIAVQMPDACMERASFHDYGDPEGGHVNVSVSMRLNHIACKLSRVLEKNGFSAFPVSATIVWRYRPYKNFPTPFLGDVSHRHMAVGAGLGEFGWNGLLMTEKYGPRVRLATVITDAALTPTPMYNGEKLCDKCMRCVKACKQNIEGLVKEVNGAVRITIGGKECEYANKNLWRCAWTENFAIKYDAPKPECINEQTMREVFRDITKKHPEYLKTWSVEPCWGECLPAHLRRIDKGYCKVPRRIKDDKFQGYADADIQTEVNGKLAELLDRRFAEYTCEIYNLSERREIAEKLEYYLPDAKSLIVAEIPFSPDDAFAQRRIWHQVLSSELDIITYLDRKGYSALQLSFTREKQYEKDLAFILEKLGKLDKTKHQDDGRKLCEFILSGFNCLEGDSRRLALVASSIELPDTTFSRNLQVEAIKPADPATNAGTIKTLAGELGVDLVGISSAGRLDEIAKQLDVIYQGKTRFFATDKNPGKGPYIPEVEEKEIKIHRPVDYLDNAQSVIVIGMTLSKGIIDLKQNNPAEVIGPYAAHRTFMLDELAEKALKIKDSIRSCGYRAVPTFDLCGTGSTFPFPIREQHPDSFCSRFAAVAAGLGELGTHGMVLTEANGVANIFMAIVTDMPLKADSLYNGSPICRNCGNCVTACPARAIQAQNLNKITVEGKEFTWAEFSHNHCDWSKKYALVGAEGPAYSGSVTDIPPLENITREGLANALSNTDEIQKDYFLVMEPCLTACPAGKS